ncbi:MAG: hypothetical protein QM775_03800 [Pirellulales bacterium]
MTHQFDLRGSAIGVLVTVATGLASLWYVRAEEPKPAPAAKPAEAVPDVKPLEAPKPVAPKVVVAAPGAVRVVAAGGGAFAVADSDNAQPEETVFRDPPRPLLQKFKRSESLIEEKRYAEAVEELGGILEEPEDYSYDFDSDGTGEGSTRRSLKGEAQRRIGACRLKVARPTNCNTARELNNSSIAASPTVTTPALPKCRAAISTRRPAIKRPTLSASNTWSTIGRWPPL